MLSSSLFSLYVVYTFCLQNSVPSLSPMCSGPFCSLQLNYLPPKKRQAIKVELHLAKTTFKLRVVVLFFKNSQEIGFVFFSFVFFFLIKTFCFWVSTELIIAQRVSHTIKHFEIWCSSFDLLFMTHSLSHRRHRKLKITECVGPCDTAMWLCSDCPERAAWTFWRLWKMITSAAKPANGISFLF